MGVSMRKHPTVSTRSVPRRGGCHKSQTSFLRLLLVLRVSHKAAASLAWLPGSPGNFWSQVTLDHSRGPKALQLHLNA